MANPYVNKVELADGTTLIDLSADTVTAGAVLSGVTAHSASGASITGNIANKSSSDMTLSGVTVTAPAGYYASDGTKTLTGVTITAPASGSSTFSVTVPNGNTTATFVFNVDSGGNVTITES